MIDKLRGIIFLTANFWGWRLPILFQLQFRLFVTSPAQKLDTHPHRAFHSYPAALQVFIFPERKTFANTTHLGGLAKVITLKFRKYKCWL